MLTRGAPRLGATIGFVFAVLGFFIGARPLDDNSFLTHLATGRLILDGGVPSTDPYTYVASGEAWTVQSWLASAMYAGVEDLAGGVGLRLFFGVQAAVLAVLVWQLTQRAESVILRVAIAGPALVIGTTMWTERPLLFGLIGFAALLLLMDRRPHPAIVVGIVWLWAQVHGSWPIWFVAGGALLVESWLDHDRQRSERRLRVLRWSVVGGLASVVSPLGLRALTFPVELLSKRDALSTIIEWKPPDWSTPMQRSFLVLCAVAFVVYLRQQRRGPLVPIAVAFLLAATAKRNFSLASLIVVFVASGMAKGMLPRLRLATDTPLRGSPAVVASVAALAFVGAVRISDASPYELRPYPVDLMAWAYAGDLDPRSVRWAHEMPVGNLLEVLEEADETVFIDDRVDMFPSDVYDEFRIVGEGRPDWHRQLTELGVDVVLWQSDQVTAQLVRESRAWRVVAGSGHYVLAVRR